MDICVKPQEPIQPAIDSAHAVGGGRVVLEPGTHPSGTIYLKSRVELHLSAGARLQGGSRPEDYDDFCDPGFDREAPEKSRKCLIAAAHAEDIAITGAGEINGAGPAFYDTNVPAGAFYAKPPHPRPRMVQLFDCKRVRLEGVSYVDSPGWTMWILGCEDVRIHGVRVVGCQQMINNDGIDIDDCRRVTVSDSFLRTGDDCLVLRAIRKYPGHHAVCENVTVTNCVLDSWCQGIRIGCPSDDTIRDCAFSNLVICGRGNGINVNNPRRYLQPGDTGYLDLHNLVFSNLTIRSGRVPISVNVEPGVTLRRLGGLTFSNIRIEADEPCKLEGCDETPIEDVRFSEVRSSSAIEAHHCRRLALNQVEVDAGPGKARVP